MYCPQGLDDYLSWLTAISIIGGAGEVGGIV